MKLTPSVPQARTRGITEIFGRAKTGKTRFAIGWPKPLHFDADGASAMLQRSHPNLPVIITKSARDILETLDGLAAENKLPETIVIDPVTAIYNAIVDAHPEDTFRTQINREFREFMERILAYPCHIVFTAWEKDEYASIGAKIDVDGETYIVKPTDTIKQGVRPDAPQIVEHLCDFVIRLVGEDSNTVRYTEVVAQRGDVLPQGGRIENFDANTILNALEPPKTKQPAPTVLITNKILVDLGKRHNEVCPEHEHITSIANYARAKGLTVPKRFTPSFRAEIAALLEADILGKALNATAAQPKTPKSNTAPAIKDASVITTPPTAPLKPSGEKFGTPSHLLYG